MVGNHQRGSEEALATEIPPLSGSLIIRLKFLKGSFKKPTYDVGLFLSTAFFDSKNQEGKIRSI
jgi:hypothetical protein